MRDIRGPRIAMVLQDPKYSLNPVMRVGVQIEESVRAHQRVGRTRGPPAHARHARSRSASAIRNGCASIRTRSRAAWASATMIAMMLIAGARVS